MSASMVAVPTRSGRRGGSGTVLRWEIFKLGKQLRTQVALGACIIAPLLFVAVLNMQSATPMDTLFGRWVHDSGFSIPLVVLTFSGQWALPAIVCIVAGDMFSSENRHGTWRTILTRSRSRTQVFAGKLGAAMCYSVLAVVLLGLSSLAAGALFVGRQPLVGLSGQMIGPGRCAALVLASWAIVIMPALAFTALGLLLSIASRNGVVGVGAPVVIGLALQLASLIDGPQWLQTILMTTPFACWHGLFVQDQYFRPLILGIIVSAIYLGIFTSAAFMLLRRRDITGS